MEECDEFWKLIDEIGVEISNLKDTIVEKEIHIDKILAASNKSQTSIEAKEDEIGELNKMLFEKRTLFLEVKITFYRDIWKGKLKFSN